MKLPVALSGGSKANCRPLAGAMLSTWPWMRASGKVSTVIIDRLARPHRRQLGFLVVRHDVDRIERHHGHELAASLDVLPDAQRPRADRAVNRSGDRGVAKVQLSLLLGGAVMPDLGCSLDTRGLQHLDLLPSGGEGGRACTTPAFRWTRREAVCWVDCVVPAPILRERLVAGMVLLGKTQLRLGRCDLLVGLFDDESCKASCASTERISLSAVSRSAVA